MGTVVGSIQRNISPQIVLEFTGLDVEAVIKASNGCRWIRKQLDGYVP